MTKKYLIICMVVTQFIHIFAGEKKQQGQSRRTSDSNKSRVSLTQSQPILIIPKKDESNRLSQSSPIDYSKHADTYSPSGYFGWGDLGNGFSPYDSSQR